MDSLNKDDVLAFLKFMADEMPKHSERLRELDAKIGDGDLGITISLGMKAIKENLGSLAEKNIGEIVAHSGMNFNRAAASTFGVIFATALMRAGKALADKQEAGVGELADMLRAAAEGAQQRGKAAVGDKTVLDVLFPMAEEAEKAAQQSLSLEQAVRNIRARCEKALAETAKMTGRHGRAGWLKEQSVGVVDPGSAAICLMVECFERYVTGKGQ